MPAQNTYIYALRDKENFWRDKARISWLFDRTVVPLHFTGWLVVGYSESYLVASRW